MVKTYHVQAPDMDEARAIWDRFDGEDTRVELVQDTDLDEDDIEFILCTAINFTFNLSWARLKY
jgi:hypothetical protein